MTAYYNEFEPYAAQWLKNLIDAKLIAAGDVDTRSILDVRASDLKGYAQCHFFAGIGGWSHALRLAGWDDSRPVWTGSCPCQPFSAAGLGVGVADERHLWPIWFELIKESRPAVVFGEQVEAAIGHGWLDIIQDNLEAEGYAVAPAVLPACSAGAPHIRQRLWFVADSQRNEQPRQEPCGGKVGRMGRVKQPLAWDRHWQSALSSFRVVGDGLPRAVGATDAARNAIVPQVAAAVIGAFMECQP